MATVPVGGAVHFRDPVIQHGPGQGVNLNLSLSGLHQSCGPGIGSGPQFRQFVKHEMRDEAQGSAVARASVAGYPLGMTTTAVIYIFRCPKGRVYAGWRGVSPEALRTWPNRGLGPLPDGYKGSGKAWRAVARRHKAALVWRIVARVDGTRADVDAAEVRAIHLARLIFGRLCLNHLDGGNGFSSGDAKRQRAVLLSDPGHRERAIAANRAIHARPGFKERQADAIRDFTARPEWIAKNAAINRARAQTPEGRATLKRASQIRWRRARARKALAPFAVPPSISRPEVCLWAFLPTLRLSITGPKGPARRR